MKNPLIGDKTLNPINSIRIQKNNIIKKHHIPRKINDLHVGRRTGVYLSRKTISLPLENMKFKKKINEFKTENDFTSDINFIVQKYINEEISKVLHIGISSPKKILQNTKAYLKNRLNMLNFFKKNKLKEKSDLGKSVNWSPVKLD